MFNIKHHSNALKLMRGEMMMARSHEYTTRESMMTFIKSDGKPLSVATSKLEKREEPKYHPEGCLFIKKGAIIEDKYIKDICMVDSCQTHRTLLKLGSYRWEDRLKKMSFHIDNSLFIYHKMIMSL